MAFKQMKFGVNLGNGELIPLKLERNRARNLFELLFNSVELFPNQKHKIFFLSLTELSSSKDISSFDTYSSVIKEISSRQIEFEIEVNKEFEEIQGDESIIEILNQMAEIFIIIIKAFTEWDMSLNFLNKVNLNLIFNQQVCTYKAAFSYLSNERVQFLKSNYAFSANAFTIFEKVLSVLEARVIGIFNFLQKHWPDETNQWDIVGKLREMKTVSEDNFFQENEEGNRFISRLINSIELFDQL